MKSVHTEQLTYSQRRENKACESVTQGLFEEAFSVNENEQRLGEWET